MKKNKSMMTLAVWLIVTATSIAYIFYFHKIRSLTEIIVSVAPTMIFFTGGLLIFNRDKNIIKKAKEKEESSRTVELEWGQALKHDIITYFIPVIILSIPFLINQTPSFTDLCQAVIVFLALCYLKMEYWGEL